MKTIQNRLEQIIASSKAVIYSAEIEGLHATTFISDNIKSQMGYETHEFLDDPSFWNTHIHPEDEPAVFQVMNHLPEYGYCTLDYRLRHHDGHYRWMHHDLMCAHDVDGNPTEIVGFWVDITEQRQLEESIWESNAKYRDIFETAHDTIILMDKDFNILNANYRAERLLGYSKVELLHMNAMEHLYVPEDRNMMQQLIDHLITGNNWEYQVRFMAKDGRVIHFDAASAPRFSPSGEFISTICTLRDVTERKGMEEALKRSEHRFKTVFANSPVPAAIARLEDAQLVDVNDAFIKLMGYEQEELIGHTAVELNLWEATEARPDMLNSPLEKGKVRTFEVQGYTKSGEVHQLLQSVELIDLDDEPCVVFMMYDVTERNQAQDELASLYRATAYLFKSDSLLNLGHQIVEAVVHEFEHVDCGLLLVNRAGNKILRLARTGAYSVDTIEPLYLDGQGLVPQAIRSGKVVYAPDVSTADHYVSSDPRTCSELVVPLHTVKGVIGVVDLQSTTLNAFSEGDQRVLVAFVERAAAAIEIMQLYEEINLHATTLEKQVAERTMQLQRAKEHIETILNGTADAIMVVNSEAVIQQVNRPFTRLFGFNSDEIFNHSLHSLLAPNQNDLLAQVIHTINSTGMTNRIDLIMHDKAGTPFDADVSLSLVMTYEGHAPNMICSIRDMTLRKRAEKELRHALEKEKELNELKTRFVSMVSHEFRTPLTVILTSADLIKRYGDRMPEEKQAEHFKRINAQVYRLTALMDDVLTIGQSDIKGTVPYPEAVDLEVFCQDIVEEIQPTALEHEIHLIMTGDCKQAHTDPALLRQILYNLLSNAIKYSPEAAKVHMELSRDQDTAMIKVTDHGIGIPEADQKHLFEVFQRASNVGKIQGTGLGLVIVKRAVEAIRGSIAVDSQMDIGTTFTITFPLSLSTIAA